MLFVTNAKSLKYPGIKLVSSESKTQLVNQRKQNSYKRKEHKYIFINSELLDGNKGHQEEAHHPTHGFRRLFIDLLSMGWRGCASAMAAIKLPPQCHIHYKYTNGEVVSISIILSNLLQWYFHREAFLPNELLDNFNNFRTNVTAALFC